MSRSAVLLSCFLACSCLLPGCSTAAGTDAASDTPGPRLILKFKPSTLACNEAGVSRAAREANVPLRLLRPMSGGACVVILAPGVKPEIAISRLSTLPAVEWAEPDAVMRAN